MRPITTSSTSDLDAAASLLGDTELSVLEIALACGYGSAAHFTAAFQKRFFPAAKRVPPDPARGVLLSAGSTRQVRRQSEVNGKSPGYLAGACLAYSLLTCAV